MTASANPGNGPRLKYVFFVKVYSTYIKFDELYSVCILLVMRENELANQF